MHARFSMVRGMSVLSEEDDELLGIVDGILLHPDTGTVEGFFIATGGILFAETLFLDARDILQWGTAIRTRDADRLTPPEEVLRLTELLADPRTVLGQKILTEKDHRSLGTCVDVQFSTTFFTLEWLFPKKFFHFKKPVPASCIVEITEEGIIIREPEVGVKEEEKKAPAEEFLREPLSTIT